VTRITIDLPESLKVFVEERAARDGYDSPDAFIRSLIREAQKGAGEDEVEAKLLEALESGPATPMTRADWDTIRDEVHMRYERRQGKTDGR
jgi:antitoxin ParD1/3/4